HVHPRQPARHRLHGHPRHPLPAPIHHLTPLRTPTRSHPEKGNPPMLKLFITLQLTALGFLTQAEGRLTKRRDERGSVTIEQVIWAGAVILIVGIVVAAIRAFVTSESAKIK